MTEILWGVVKRETQLLDSKNIVTPVGYFKKEALRFKNSRRIDWDCEEADMS